MKNKIWVISLSMLLSVSLSYAQEGEKGSHSDHKGSHGMEEHQVRQMDHQGGHTDQAFVPGKYEEDEISHYTCGMHPSVHVSVEHFKKGDDKCPICFMPLTPVRMDTSSNQTFDENVISKVSIQLAELKLAGVQTETTQRRQLFKEIRAVGTVAYDPQLAIAQEEFISTVKSYDKSKTGAIEEIIERSKSLVESSKRKLMLLGLNEEQIKALEQSQQVQANLTSSSEQMWIYGDVYEYELPWIKQGSYIKAMPIGLVGKEFYGEVVSINPVVDPRTRSVRFRALVENPEGTLRPEMYVDIEIMSEYTDPNGNTEVVSIPKSALLDTGRRRIVWVDQGNGQFEGRTVEIGPESIAHSNQLEKFYPVLKGIKEGERVVTKGNFLIDSQSQITGVASASFGGALEPVEHTGMTGHKH